MMLPAGWDHPELAHAIRTEMAARAVEASRRVVDEASRQIAESRRRIALLQKSPGGSVGPLRDEIRARLAAGTLPRSAGHAWMGAARGDRRCACCGQPIVAPASECVVRDRVELYAHAPCFRLWVEESTRPPASSWGSPARVAVSRSCAAQPPSDAPSSFPRHWRAR
jgi:hypothetical protein